MLKKLLTGCLTIAMIGAFSASASAETTFTWSGNVEADWILSHSSKDATEDAETISYMDMKATGDLDLSVKHTGDVWTAEAKLETDWNESAIAEVDDLYVTLSNDALTITFGSIDVVGIGRGVEYLGAADKTYYAGDGGTQGLGVDINSDGDTKDNLEVGKTATFNEKPLLQLGLNEVGLALLVGFDRSISTDATGDQNYSETYYGVTFEKTFGMVDLGLQYTTLSTSVNEDESPRLKEGYYDGYSGSTLGIGVGLGFSDMMALSINIAQSSAKSGASTKANFDDVDSLNWDLIFDMGLSETQGFTVAYSSGTDSYKAETSGTDDVVVTTSVVAAGFMFKLGDAENYLDYYSKTWKGDYDDAEAGQESQITYRMKVEF